MFTDMSLSKDLMAAFKASAQGGMINGVEFISEILTNGHWPE